MLFPITKDCDYHIIMKAEFCFLGYIFLDYKVNKSILTKRNYFISEFIYFVSVKTCGGVDIRWCKISARHDMSTFKKEPFSC